MDCSDVREGVQVKRCDMCNMVDDPGCTTLLAQGERCMYVYVWGRPRVYKRGRGAIRELRSHGWDTEMSHPTRERHGRVTPSELLLRGRIFWCKIILYTSFLFPCLPSCSSKRSDIQVGGWHSWFKTCALLPGWGFYSHHILFGWQQQRFVEIHSRL